MIFAFRFELQEPADAFVQDAGIERVDDELTALFGKNEVSLAEQIEMVRDGGLADLEVLGDRAGGQVPGPEKFEDFPAGRIVQCFEDEVQVFVFRQISKYSAGLSSVEWNAWMGAVPAATIQLRSKREIAA